MAMRLVFNSHLFCLKSNVVSILFFFCIITKLVVTHITKIASIILNAKCCLLNKNETKNHRENSESIWKQFNIFGFDNKQMNAVNGKKVRVFSLCIQFFFSLVLIVFFSIEANSDMENTLQKNGYHCHWVIRKNVACCCCCCSASWLLPAYPTNCSALQQIVLQLLFQSIQSKSINCLRVDETAYWK